MAKANMRMTKNPMPEQEPLVRNKNFEEVALGYTKEMDSPWDGRFGQVSRVSARPVAGVR